MCYIDVKELHDWHVSKLSNHPNFVPVASGYRNIPSNALINTESTNSNPPTLNIDQETTNSTNQDSTNSTDSTSTTTTPVPISYYDYDEGDYANDPCITAILMDTEESKKVRRNKGPKYYCVFRRITEEELMNKTPIWVNNIFHV